MNNSAENNKLIKIHILEDKFKVCVHRSGISVIFLGPTEYVLSKK